MERREALIEFFETFASSKRSNDEQIVIYAIGFVSIEYAKYAFDTLGWKIECGTWNEACFEVFDAFFLIKENQADPAQTIEILDYFFTLASRKTPKPSTIGPLYKWTPNRPSEGLVRNSQPFYYD